jgi:hypothetical protein
MSDFEKCAKIARAAEALFFKNHKFLDIILNLITFYISSQISSQKFFLHS